MHRRLKCEVIFARALNRANKSGSKFRCAPFAPIICSVMRQQTMKLMIAFVLMICLLKRMGWLKDHNKTLNQKGLKS
jgi:hypothetical protein